MRNPLKAFKSEGQARSLWLSHKHNENAESQLHSGVCNRELKKESLSAIVQNMYSGL